MSRRVVVTGMGAVTPVGNDVKTFWDGLVSGKNGIGPITKFDASGYKVKLAAEVRDFHPEDYMEKPMLRRTDLYCQYAMAATAQAMEDSGIAGKVAPERLGVYIGSGIGGMKTFIEECTKLNAGGPRKVSPLFIPKLIANIAAGNVAVRYHAQGPSLCVVTACATSAHCIGEAYRAIQRGDADAIITGGAEATINGLGIAGFTNCMALSKSQDPARASIPFDRERNGFVMGEGGAILILEEYEHALSRGAKVYAELCGYGNTNDAYHMTAPQPDGIGAARAIRAAVREAGVAPDAKLYINAHGTSTTLNDRTETLAFKRALGPQARTALVSSTKSMTGHMLGATGAAEAIAAVLALKTGVVPPTIGYRVPDPECDLDYVPNKARKAKLDFSLSTNLGFGGHNACLVFRKAQQQ